MTKLLLLLSGSIVLSFLYPGAVLAQEPATEYEAYAYSADGVPPPPEGCEGLSCQYVAEPDATAQQAVSDAVRDAADDASESSPSLADALDSVEPIGGAEVSALAPTPGVAEENDGGDGPPSNARSGDRRAGIDLLPATGGPVAPVGCGMALLLVGGALIRLASR